MVGTLDAYKLDMPPVCPVPTSSGIKESRGEHSTLSLELGTELPLRPGDPRETPVVETPSSDREEAMDASEDTARQDGAGVRGLFNLF